MTGPGASPAPRRGGPLALLRFARSHRMLRWRYVPLALRLAYWKLRLGRRLQLDGPAFLGRGVRLQVGPAAVLRLGRWTWIGGGTKIRVHEGRCEIGDKSVLGEECTISAYLHVSLGRECLVADRAMFIDFDHVVTDPELPIRAQGIHKAPVRVGNNVWVGYGACVLRGVTVGDNGVLGTNAVVTKDVPADRIAGGVPARILKERPAPQTLRWS